jgi:uncharacterized protein
VSLGDVPGSGTGGSSGDVTGGAPDSGTGGTGGTGIGSTGGTTGGVGGKGGSVTAGTTGAQPVTGGSAGVDGSGGLGTGGTAGSYPSAGTAGTSLMGGAAGINGDPSGGTAGTEVTSGGMAGTGAGASGGTAGAAPTGPYEPRTGTFKVLAYSKTSGFRHANAIDAGKTMLDAMGMKQGFTVTYSESPADFNLQNLEQYELVFGLNPTGNNLSPAQRVDFEEWMTTKNGAFAGVHSSTDHESGWAFWSDVTGQYHDGHDIGGFTMQNISWQPGVEDYVFVKGLPSPWVRAEEWFKFNSYATWSQKPGFKILNLVTTNGLTRPVSFIREWGNFRSFYTSLGHNDSSYWEETFVKHVGGGLMWAVRREAQFVP